MKLRDLVKSIGAEVLFMPEAEPEIFRAHGGDRISDFLVEAREGTLLVTNLRSLQMLKVAAMMDAAGICLAGTSDEPEGFVCAARTCGKPLVAVKSGLKEVCGLIDDALRRNGGPS